MPWNKGIKTGLIPKTAFKKGFIPWNKGMVGISCGPSKVERVEQNCKCGTKFNVIPSKLGKAKYCSKNCLSRFRMVTLETRLKMSSCKKGKPTKSHPAWNKGLRGYKAKEQHYKYKPDRTQLKTSEKKHKDGRYREWMFAVKNRDNWKCKMSNSDCDGRLESHHILNWVNYPELRYEINNGITLCHAHHPRGRAKERELVPTFRGLISAIAN